MPFHGSELLAGSMPESYFSVTFNRRIAMRHRQPVVSPVTVTVSGFTGAYSKLLSSGVRHS
jgi:hypothetical protein